MEGEPVDMRFFPRDVLAAQRNILQLPVAYLGCAAEREINVSVFDVAETALRFLVAPQAADHLAQKRISSELLRSSDPGALRRALTLPLLRRGLGKQAFLLLDQLDRTDSRNREDIKLRRALFKERNARLSRINDLPQRFAFVEKRLDEVTQLLSARPDQAENVMSELEADIESAEAHFIEELKKRLDQRFKTVVENEYKRVTTSIELALAEGNYERAHDLLKRHSESGTTARSDFAPQRGPLPQADIQQLVRWIAREEPAPIGFQRQWGVIEDDAVSRELFSAVAQCIRSDESMNLAKFTTVARALGRMFGALGEYDVALDVVQTGDSWRVRIPCPKVPGFYALEQYGAGIIVACAAPPTPTMRLKPEDSDSDSDDDDVEVRPEDIRRSVDAEIFGEYYLSIGDSPVAIPKNLEIRIDWRTLLALVGDRSRIETFVRVMGAAIRPVHSFPDATHRSDDSALAIGRDSVVDVILQCEGSVMWIGPRGSGRTSVLKHAVAEARRREWNVERITSLADVHHLSARIESSVRKGESAISSFIQSRCPGTLITCDDLEDLAGAQADIVARVVTLFQTLQDAAAISDVSIACVAMASPEILMSNLRAPWRMLPPLSFDDVRHVILHLLNITGVSVDATAIDHIAYASGGHVRLVHLFLRRLHETDVKEGGVRLPRQRVTPDLAAKTVASRDVRGEARRMLFEPLMESAKDLAATFLAVLSETRGSDSATVSVRTVQSWLKSEAGLDVSVEMILQHLSALEASYLVAGKSDAWRLSGGGIAALLLDEESEDFVSGLALT